MKDNERIEKEAIAYGEIFNSEAPKYAYRRGYIAGANATRLRYMEELEKAKQEIANHKAVNSLLLDSTEEAKLANHIHELQSVLQQYREALKELIPIAEDRLFSVPVKSPEGVQEAIERTKSLTDVK